MSVQVVSSTNIPKQGLLLKNTPYLSLASTSVINTDIKDEINFSIANKEKKSSKKLKIAVAVSTLVGVSAAMANILKGKGYSLSPAKIFNGQSPKNWGLFNATYNENEMPKLVAKLALGSVAGGFIGGAIFDKKENLNAKCREAVIQLVGYIFTPLVTVLGVMKVYDTKLKDKILAKIPEVKNAAGKVTVMSNIKRAFPGAAATILSLTAAVFAGNKIGNMLNEKIFHVKDDRKIKLSDMSPHIDDLCIAVSLAGADGQSGAILKRIIPAALMVAGYSVGTAKEKPEHLAAKASKSVELSLVKNNSLDVVK